MMNVDQNLCIQCGRCTEACPAGIFEKQEDGSIAAQQKECMDCFHCTSACPTHAISHHELGRDACYPEKAAEDSLLAKFQRRRSIRRFKPDTPDRTLIQAALDGAAYAPSAKNQQVCRWTVVLGKEKVERIYRLSLDWAKTQRDYRHLVWLDRHGRNPVTCNAPGLVLVHCPEDCHNPQTDAAIALTLAEQLLVESGFGTCWAGYLCRMINQCDELKAALNLPEGHQVYGVLMTGIPNETYPNIPHRPTADINWVE